MDRGKIFAIGNDPIKAVMMDGIDPDAATDVAQLHAAVCRAIMCKLKWCEGNVLDTSTASLCTSGGEFVTVCCPTCATELKIAAARTDIGVEELAVRTATEILEPPA
jgi:hypothetical protein